MKPTCMIKVNLSFLVHKKQHNSNILNMYHFGMYENNNNNNNREDNPSQVHVCKQWYFRSSDIISRHFLTRLFPVGNS